MATIVVAPAARADLHRLIRTHDLPPSTVERTARAIRPLARFPSMGRALLGAWSGYRFVIGPWAWMLIVYVSDETADLVAIVTIQDGGTAAAPRS